MNNTESSQISCNHLNIVGHIFYLIFATSFMLNLYLLLILTKYNKSKRKPMNSLIIFQCILNLFATVFHLPFYIVSYYSCRWVFYEIGCVFAGFVMYAVGCISVYIVVTISLIRYLILISNKSKLFE